MKLRLTEAQKREAVAHYEAGESCQQVAARFGVTRQAMWDVLRRRTAMRPNLRYGQTNHFWRGGSQAEDAAQNKLEKAIKRGEITRPDTCSRCGTAYRFKDGRTAIQAHHPDYSHPLDVIWLCQRCHHREHREVMPPEASTSTSSAEASRDPARTSPSPDDEPGSPGSEPACSSRPSESSTLFDPDGFSSRTYPGCSPRTAVGTSESLLERWPTSGTAWDGGFSTAVSSECRSADGACSSSEPGLGEILEPPQSVPGGYSLSARAATGILRRAEKRGRALPSHLSRALETVARTTTTGRRDGS